MNDNDVELICHRTTTVHSRFQVTCSYCGILDYGDKTFKNALATAQRALPKHTSPDEKIEIFDLMAHKGKPELWDATGKVLRRRS